MKKFILFFSLILLSVNIVQGWYLENQDRLPTPTNRKAWPSFTTILLDSTGTTTTLNLPANHTAGDDSFAVPTQAFIPFPTTRIFISLEDTTDQVTEIKIRWYGAWFDEVADSLKSDLIDSTVVAHATLNSDITIYDVIGTATEDSYLYQYMYGVVSQTADDDSLGSTTLKVGIIRSYE